MDRENNPKAQNFNISRARSLLRVFSQTKFFICEEDGELTYTSSVSDMVRVDFATWKQERREELKSQSTGATEQPSVFIAQD